MLVHYVILNLGPYTTLGSQASPSLEENGSGIYGAITQIILFSRNPGEHEYVNFVAATWRLYACTNHNSAYLADKHWTGSVQAIYVQWLACHYATKYKTFVGIRDTLARAC